ncbi:hypothetical protein CY34DRAFT_799933 [Suillus luteus UH-Slu-Lm8-n1]|uniref:Uncharacterized protein n=1 Tax=Suillus luteus UH-Slu-Lm8-n1 TaxID=930992 RepID=A0A0D0BB35_9AGAM|nr:hypothetical protein CY34DRAFT_799933 [Suillus luteus UH-Slu-Lm8-n1]
MLPGEYSITFYRCTLLSPVSVFSSEHARPLPITLLTTLVSKANSSTKLHDKKAGGNGRLAGYILHVRSFANLRYIRDWYPLDKHVSFFTSMHRRNMDDQGDDMGRTA